MQSYAMEHFNEAAKEAEKAMRGVFERTPLQKNAHLSAIYGADIWLKREDLSPVRSYKLRGAFNAMRKQDKNKLFVAASAGNHAQGVAYMCKHFGVKGTIFMPVTTPKQKIQKTEIFGSDAIQIELVGDYFDDCLKAAQGFCKKNNGHFLSPFDDADVIEGQASVAVEIEAQLGFCPDHIVMPVGGGGLSAGVLNYFKNSAQYSLIEPLEEAGVRVINLDDLTGLPEYRNGGLFLDTKVLKIINSKDLLFSHNLKSSLVVEWRALTVALLDKLADEVRFRTGDDAESLPLASVLQGGTWSAGRRIASQLRESGASPLSLHSSGTIF